MSPQHPLRHIRQRRRFASAAREEIAAGRFGANSSGYEVEALFNLRKALIHAVDSMLKPDKIFPQQIAFAALQRDLLLQGSNPSRRVSSADRIRSSFASTRLKRSRAGPAIYSGIAFLEFR
ncbi:MAG: hypothetical protein ACLPPF_02625 [Rhodomicrobium sp.]